MRMLQGEGEGEGVEGWRWSSLKLASLKTTHMPLVRVPSPSLVYSQKEAHRKLTFETPESSQRTRN
jgi:hypothetical protein